MRPIFCASDHVRLPVGMVSAGQYEGHNCIRRRNRHRRSLHLFLIRASSSRNTRRRTCTRSRPVRSRDDVALSFSQFGTLDRGGGVCARTYINTRVHYGGFGDCRSQARACHRRTGAPRRANQTIVIRDAHIAHVGDTGTIIAPPSAHIFDLPGRTVVPGYVMLHEHLSFTPDAATKCRSASVSRACTLRAGRQQSARQVVLDSKMMSRGARCRIRLYC
jgi:hypothetical protein